MDYKKFRWFFTKSGKLVYGGKSAEQNEEIVASLLKENKNLVVMHTRIPGSPFAIIESSLKKVNESDLEECAIWCGCFSRAWRTGLKKTQIDVFSSMQIVKKKGMKSGTFAVAGPIDKKNVELRLFSCFQNDVLRFVPEKTLTNKTKETICITPGKITKEKLAEDIAKRLELKKESVLNALPSGAFRIC